MKKMMTQKITLRNKLLHFLLGTRCAVCDAASQSAVCTNCTTKIIAPKLSKSDVPTPAYDVFYALAAYETSMRALIHAYKYERQTALAAWFAVQIDVFLQNHMANDGETCTHIVAMPLHESRLNERGYNQCYEIVKRLTMVKLNSVNSAPNLLTRTRATERQAHLPRAARQDNVAQAFWASQPLHGARVWLLDDVVTTGATVNEAAKALKQAGAAWVGVIALARA